MFVELTNRPELIAVATAAADADAWELMQRRLIPCLLPVCLYLLFKYTGGICGLQVAGY